MKQAACGLLMLAAFSLPACAEQDAATENVSISPDTQAISVAETHALVSSGQATLIDVRRSREWSSTGMAEGAIGITLQDEDFLDQILASVENDKSRPIALICQTGGRSWFAQKRLQAEGFTTVVNVTGGTRDWIDQALPVTAYSGD